MQASKNLLSSLLLASKVSQTQPNATENEGLWEVWRWLPFLLTFVFVFVIFLIIATVDIVLALLDPELQVEELLEMAE